MGTNAFGGEKLIDAEQEKQNDPGLFEEYDDEQEVENITGSNTMICSFILECFPNSGSTESGIQPRISTVGTYTGMCTYLYYLSIVCALCSGQGVLWWL